MKPLPLAALVAAAALSTLIVMDVLWNAANPNQPGPWVDPDTAPGLARFTSVVHAALYALLATALVRYGRVIDGGRRFVTVVRWIITAGYGLFAVLFGWLIVDPAVSAEGPLGVISTIAFVATLLAPIPLGFALVRRREFRVPAMLLIAPVVVLPLTFALDAFTEFGHPGYLETVVNFGVALLCVAASTTARTVVEGPAEATAAAIR